MGEENQECTAKDATLKLICQIEKNYKDNFDAQAKLLKNITNKAMSKTSKIDGMNEKSHLDPFTFILDFLGRGQDGRKELAKKIMDKEWKEYNQILFLGIQNLTRAKGAHLKKEVDKECNENNEKKDIQECLKSIFCKQDDQKCLKEELKEEDIKKLKDVFKEPLSTVTSVLYWLYPEQYIPFDKNSKKLYEKLNLTCDNKKIEIKDDWKCYEKVLKALKELPCDSKQKIFVGTDGNFKPSMIIALSFAAWQLDNEVQNILDKFVAGGKKAKNIILTGIPGTGKTYSIMEFLKDTQKYEYEFVQFHPSYDYEDFIEGLKPVPTTTNGIEFKLVNGVFKNLCKKAFKDKEKTFVMVIDEINRANLSRVFGELLYCLEYREEFVSTKMTSYIQLLSDETQKKEFSVCDKEIGKFAIPDNVIILGTMNEVDRSIDAFDLALRRRFVWEDVGFNETALRLYTPFFTNNNFQANIEGLIKKANCLNIKLAEEFGENYKIGHTYYFKIIDYFDGDFESALCDLWDYHIKSLVREYCKIKFGEHELSKKLEEYKEKFLDEKNCNG